MAEFLAILVPALGHTLLHFLWQGALIGLLALLALYTLRHARPQARYAVACLALLACILVPLFSVLVQLAAISFAPTHGVTPVYLPGIASSHSPDLLLGFVAPTAQFDAVLPWIVALWAAGTCVLSLRMALGLAWIRSLRHAPQSAAQVAWQNRLDILVVHFGLRRRVALRLVDTLESPVSAGWWHPVVLLPASLLTRMPTDLIEALLAHELAHIRRHDYLVNLLQNAVEALLFYHPVTWWLSHRIRIEREQIADQIAAEVACAPRSLALALSELAELHRTRPALHLAQAARGGQLMSRIEHLVRPVRRDHPGARFAFPLLGLAAACIASYSYAQIGKPASDGMKPTPGASQVSDEHDVPVRQTFALVRKGDNRITIWGPDDDMTESQAAKRAGGDDLLWVRRAGQDYVITDPSLLARARQAWREAEVLSQQMDTLSSQMEVHNTKVEAIGGRMEALSVTRETPPDSGTAQREMEDLKRQQQEIERQQNALAKLHSDAVPSDTAQLRFEREMDLLTMKHGALGDKLVRLYEQQLAAEARHFEAQQESMEVLAREMDTASKPMDALGRQIEVLRHEQENAADQAAREVRKLISEALTMGLAKSAPRPVSAQ